MNKPIYSPNLEKFIKKQTKLQQKFGKQPLIVVKTDQSLEQYIGYYSCDDFIGRPLWSVLCNVRAIDGIHMNVKDRWSEITDFFEQYKLHGVCYLDPKHIWYSQRWVIGEDEKTRICSHCNYKEYQKIELVEKKTWTTEPQD